MHNEWEKHPVVNLKLYQKLSFRPGNMRSHRKKALFEAWERRIAEMAGLGTAFPCGPAHFNP